MVKIVYGPTALLDLLSCFSWLEWGQSVLCKEQVSIPGYKSNISMRKH